MVKWGGGEIPAPLPHKMQVTALFLGKMYVTCVLRRESYSYHKTMAISGKTQYVRCF